jgi:hypothetical protein
MICSRVLRPFVRGELEPEQYWSEFFGRSAWTGTNFVLQHGNRASPLLRLGMQARPRRSRDSVAGGRWAWTGTEVVLEHASLGPGHARPRPSARAGAAGIAPRGPGTLARTAQNETCAGAKGRCARSRCRVPGYPICHQNAPNRLSLGSPTSEPHWPDCAPCWAA